ncbi:MAG: TIGR03936 family radical SAM-associated protein [Oscillospiraceae bacterium]|jgi:radical SAM-linked protein|nr:TIGR03936 family radical SAM-associated protein [Oscillospiraceae bacterium]
MQLNVRLAYHKTGRARFLSHLDTMRVFQQSLTRAGLPLRYTEGFNPHIVLSIALPLGVGVESVAERLDFGIMENSSIGTIPARLNAVLPEGFHAAQAVIGGRAVSQIAFARYAMTVETQTEPERAQKLFTMSAVVQKRNKKKDYIPTDIVPFIRDIDCRRDGDRLFFSVTLTAKDPILNPEYIAEAWRTYLDPEAAFAFTRVALLDGDGKAFDAM